MSAWLHETFGVKKPIIGMCHLPGLPGDPTFDAEGGMAAVVEHGRREIKALQAGGIDGILISNEFSLPYLTSTEPITAIAMARVIGELLPEITVPFGVNVLWDGIASIDLASATGAVFVREVFTGVYASDFGLWNTDVGRSARHRVRMNAQSTKLLYNIVPEAATYLANRDLAQLTKSTVFNGAPDGLCVSGLTAGAGTDTQALKTVKENAGDTPVFVNTGVRPETVAESLQYADAAIVGTWLKHDGVFANNVESERVAELMKVVRELR